MDRRGFTIPELLLFIAIFSTAMVAFITMLITATRIQSRQSSANEVETQGQFLLQQIQYYVQSAQVVDMTQDVATGTLKVRELVSAQDPTFISVNTTTVNLQQGTNGALQALTSAKITVTGLTFTRHFALSASSTAYGNDSVSYSFTMTANASNTTQSYSQTFQSSATVFSPVEKIILMQKAKAENNGSGVTTVSSTFPSNNATGSLLIAVVSNTTSSASVVSIADSAGNTWNKIANPKYAAYNQEITIFAALNSKNAFNVVTTTFSIGVTAPSLFLYEYRGAATSSSLDASSTALQTGSASPSSSLANPAAGVELLFGVLYSNPSTEIPNAGTGFTMETTSTVSATYVEDQNIYVTGPVAAIWQYPTQSPSSSATVITFK